MKIFKLYEELTQGSLALYHQCMSQSASTVHRQFLRQNTSDSGSDDDEKDGIETLEDDSVLNQTEDM